jgi:hypothetical protein
MTWMTSSAPTGIRLILWMACVVVVVLLVVTMGGGMLRVVSRPRRVFVSLSSNGGRDTRLDLGRGLVSWPAHRAASGLPAV